MDPRVEKVLKLPLYQRILIVLVLMVLLAAGFYYLFYQAQLEEYAKQEKMLETVTAKLVENRRIAANLPKFKAEYENLKLQLDQALTELPDKKEIPALLTSIGDLARQQGLDVLLFKPATEVTKGFYAEVPVDLKLTGAYHDVAMFFDAVGNLPRIVNIGGLKMGKAKEVDDRTSLSVDCRATTFRFLESADESGGKGKK
ncbi:MAG: type 4a pilus biogenesis protein PilO [Desulfuromonadales bacterium]|nr:type 4a pilus biogenesis protein PilO [Desulfuromonadales bacterium]